jgi:hypothetical protein
VLAHHILGGPGLSAVSSSVPVSTVLEVPGYDAQRDDALAQNPSAEHLEAMTDDDPRPVPRG